MKDFDAERKVREDRRFVIGGKEFRFRKGVQAELVDAYYDALDDDAGTNAQLLERIDQLILGGLEPAFHDEWRAVRQADVEMPLMGQELHGVINYMFEVMHDRPTGPSPGSTDTSGTPGTQSTETSPLPAAT